MGIDGEMGEMNVCSRSTVPDPVCLAMVVKEENRVRGVGEVRKGM